MTEPGFYIESSNSLPRLLGRMAAVLCEDPLPPLEWERIVVQSGGMRRWVTLELARELGIAASISMPFPRNAAGWLARKLLGSVEDDEGDPFNRGPLTWRLMAILGGNLGGDEFAPVRAYLADNDTRKRYQLAAKIASTFDEYQLYRTELLRDWDIEDPDAATFRHLGWQSKLWRRVCAGLKGQEHLGDRFRRLISHINTLDGPVDEMPQRLSVFGASSLPPIFIELLAALGRHIQVTVYRFSPTRARKAEGDGSELEGNRLLGSMGGQGTEFLQLLLEKGAVERTPEQATAGALSVGETEREANGTEADTAGPKKASAPGRDGMWILGGDDAVPTCLQVIQKDILDDVDRGGDDAIPLDPNDRSLTIHNCHSPLREMEVLHDLLLNAFDTMEGLRPSDVLVMMPVIQDYAPYIDAVFGVKHEGAPHIPYRIADRQKSEEQPLSEGVLKVLALADARLTATEVIDLLEIPSVRRKAAIRGDELPQIRHWVRETNIRWGVDGDFKKDVFDLPDFQANTWRAGLDRLLMGMITGPRDDLVAGVLPLGTATMSHLDLLGRFDTWVTGLFQFLEAMRTPRPLTEWADLLSELLESFFAPMGGEEQDLQSVRDELNRLRRAGLDGKGGGGTAMSAEPARAGGDSTVAAVGPDMPEAATNGDQGSGGDAGATKGAGAMLLDIAVIRDHLGQALGEEGRAVSFISGAVTFCALKPMRTIPFKVIAVVGLDDGSFPSKERPPTFDLMAARPVAGDRSVRADQKQLFLETLAAASERLIISYVGRSQKDNKERAASVVVDELLNVVDQSLSLREEAPPPEGSPLSSRGGEEAGEESGRRGTGRRGTGSFVPVPSDCTPRDAVTTLHPLQPFNPAYFDRSDDRLFSYSTQNCQAAEGVRATRAAKSPPDAIPFFTEPIPLSEEQSECLELTLDELIACWTHPCKFFCNKSLGIILPREEAELEDIEPLEVAGLEKYAFENWLANERLKLAAGRGPGEPMPTPDMGHEWDILQARGDLPPSSLGRAYHAQLGTQVQQFVEKVGAPALIDPLTVKLEGEVEGQKWKLTGRVESLTDQGRVQFRCSTLKPKDIIQAWFTHLAFNAHLDAEKEKGRDVSDMPRVTRLVGTDDPMTFGRVKDPAGIIGRFINDAREILQRPVPLFERASYAYELQLQAIDAKEKAGKKTGNMAKPQAKAYGAWNGEQFRSYGPEGDKEDPYIKLCYRDSHPLEEQWEEFERWAKKLWRGVLGAGGEL